VNKVPTMERMHIYLTTHVPVTGVVRENPISKTMTTSQFMNDNVENTQRLCQQNEEKEARIKELEGRLQEIKIDERILQSFRVRVEKVRREIE